MQYPISKSIRQICMGGKISVWLFSLDRIKKGKVNTSGEMKQQHLENSMESGSYV